MAVANRLRDNFGNNAQTYFYGFHALCRVSVLIFLSMALWMHDPTDKDDFDVLTQDTGGFYYFKWEGKSEAITDCEIGSFTSTDMNTDTTEYCAMATDTSAYATQYYTLLKIKDDPAGVFNYDVLGNDEGIDVSDVKHNHCETAYHVISGVTLGALVLFGVTTLIMIGRHFWVVQLETGGPTISILKMFNFFFYTFGFIYFTETVKMNPKCNNSFKWETDDNDEADVGMLTIFGYINCAIFGLDFLMEFLSTHFKDSRLFTSWEMISSKADGAETTSSGDVESADSTTTTTKSLYF